MLKVFMFVALLIPSFVHAEVITMNRTFKLALFETKAACEEAQKDSGRRFNCFMTVTLYDNGHAKVMLTDIMNHAEYVLNDDRLTVTLIGPGDAPDIMNFRLTRNHRNLIDEDFQVWEWR